VTQVVGFGVDITERRRAEAERMHLAYIVQTSHDAIISRSIDHRILSWNAGAERLFGYAAEEVLGREVSLIIAPECLRRYNERREQSSSGRAAGQHETVCMAKNGSRIDVAVSSSLVKNEMGELVAVSIILRDITEQKRSEAQQRLAASVLESAAEGVVITDIAQNVVSMNHAFTQITGFERADAASRNPRLLACAAHPGSSYEEIWATVRRDGHWRGEVWDRRKNGELYCALLSINAVRNEQGDVVNYCALLMDVTQRKSAEAKLTRLNAELEDRVAARTRQLESANKELAAFSYSVSHDLRAPLRAVAGFSALVLAKSRDVTDPETRNRLQRIHANAERMGVLIDDLLRLSRVSQRELDRRRFDLSALAAEALANLRRMEPGRVVDASVQPGMMADGDPMLVRLVLDNLIGNAWKFTGRTSRPRITVTAHEEDGNGAYCVSDNGAGFDMQYAGKLFNAFQRLHRSDEFDGTGIGLSIVHRVVAKHGGKVWADAAVGRGARFYFTLG
jgi:PAS domain S-box-containing protein